MFGNVHDVDDGRCNATRDCAGLVLFSTRVSLLWDAHRGSKRDERTLRNAELSK